MVMMVCALSSKICNAEQRIMLTKKEIPEHLAKMEVLGQITSLANVVRALQGRAVLRVKLAECRVRICGSVLKSVCIPKQDSESISRVCTQRFRVAFSKCHPKPVLSQPGYRF
jgi:hypothetical protein